LESGDDSIFTCRRRCLIFIRSCRGRETVIRNPRLYLSYDVLEYCIIKIIYLLGVGTELESTKKKVTHLEFILTLSIQDGTFKKIVGTIIMLLSWGGGRGGGGLW